MLKRLLPRLAAVLGPLLVRLYFLTIRIRDDPAIRAHRYRPRVRGLFAFWHDQQLAMLWHYRHRGAWVLVSQHRDGEAVAAVAERMGVRTVRGSSTRGGPAALKRLVDLARAGWGVVVTPDGPRGPRHKVKPGVLYLARRTGLPIRCVAIGFSDFWTLKSWDRFRIPKPFGVGYAMWSEPIAPPGPGAEAAQAFIERLEEALDRLADEADRRAAAIRCGKLSGLSGTSHDATRSESRSGARG